MKNIKLCTIITTDNIINKDKLFPVYTSAPEPSIVIKALMLQSKSMYINYYLL